ncbi:unnamed protein product [Tilletia controversa]|uniref:2,4-dienoyl-CoA reductase [(3E)-enoyl-CoA-producing] n=1 Tax=Tilletia caries TaxID=13290 RepID=A0ABN7IPV7_9BASI|nr:unnamed protein product [Tilletia caries]CAD6946652.1 unnamed protein product [Tilletia laevis]CAD6956224.1 unnamed protein product [Tilletia controversa]
MADPVILSAVPSTDIFKDDIFKGKVVFCTGGGSGICYTVVESLMRHGADAAIVGRKADRLQASAKELEKTVPGRKCIATPGDVRKFDDLVAAVKQTVEAFGRIDFVIAGAAGNFMAPIEGVSSNGGSYIHISATLHYYGLAWQAPASAAKAGVDALSATAAIEFGPWGIRSNTIAPGPVRGTEGLERLTPKGAEDMIATKIPMQRVAEKDDIANAAVFLFSPAASYITGTKVVVDGGAWQTAGAWLPYPDSTLDAKSLREVIVGSKL